MNGTLPLGGDLSGLDSGLLPPHQSYSQPDPVHYHAPHNLSMSSPGMGAVGPNSAQFVQQPPASNLAIARFVDNNNSMNNTSSIGYGVKLHSGVGGLGGLGVHSVIPQLPSDPSSMMRTSSSSSASTSSPHGHLTITPSSSSGPTMSLPQVSDNTDVPLSSTSLLTQMNQLGPSERCTPSQAVSMGQQLLSIIAQHERSKMPLPSELQNSFDVFHRCLAVVYGTFFLNLYTKANAPCLLCHGCKSLYPPGQFIHHSCPTLPPNILPCRSRMWRRCLVPLVSQGMDKLQQKQRWKYVLEKFSHTAAAVAGRRNPIPPEIEAQLLEMPELKRGRFIEEPAKQKRSDDDNNGEGVETEPDKDISSGMVHGLGIETGKMYQSLGSIDEEGVKEETNNCSLEGARNLLDIEPPEYDLEESSSPSDTQAQPSLQTAEGGGGGRGREVVLLPGNGTSVLGLAEQLVSEVRSLQHELAVSRIKLKTATVIIDKMPSEACMREQLAHALSTQQTLMVERDQAREQLRLAQDRGNRLQKQLDGIKLAFSNVEKYLM